MKTLELDRFPLTGTRLIEASAGTGKTFTLTALYLRLLLERGLDVPQLLVVTFTEAATDELRGRVRARLREAAAAFEAGESGDPVLAGLLRRLDDHGARAQQLRDAITRLDEAAIFTIHGFCQRMLTEHAFESGALFDTELTTDEQALREAVINDFWRTRFYDADRAFAAWVRERWATPAALLDELSPWVHNAVPRVLPPADDRSVAEAEAGVDAARARAGSVWSASDIERLLLEAKGLSRAERAYRPDRVQALVAAAEAYFAGGNGRFVPAELADLTPERLAAGRTPGAVNKGIAPPEHPFFERCATLVACARELDVRREARLLSDAADYLRDGLARRKREHRHWTFNDLLVDLDTALHAPGGEALAASIRSRFPAALVDEFQDTDPLQYRIFDTVYGAAGDAGAWFMIGDPKQAIYGFRGADIFTYIQARRDTDPATQHFTLGINWRSAEALVRAVNTLFSQASAPFIFDRDIDFLPVQPSGRADEAPFTVDGETPSALAVWFVERTEDNIYHGTISKRWAQEALSGACAGEIARLLTLGADQRACLGEQGVQAGDIAVLVRDRHEADVMRAALSQAGIKSVYISRDSVFATSEAEALEHVLTAVAEPGVERRLRAALATDLLGADAAALSAGDDDPHWQDWLACFQTYHALWAEKGFMPFFQRFLSDQVVAERLLARPDGERRLTNVLQLGELAQTASETVWGMEAMLRWLGFHRRHPDGDAEDQQLRLESDAGLVKIVTIHKSKGLEYPIVFLPFPWVSRPGKETDGQRPAAVEFHDPADRAYTLDLGSASHAEHYALSENERLAEDLRLLYVALTRARHRCYLTWGQFYGAAESALAYLLHPAAEGARGCSDMAALDDGRLRAAWQRLAERADGAIAVAGLPDNEIRQAPQGAREGEELRARAFTGRVPRGWQIASYSALISGQTALQPAAGAESPDYDAVDTRPNTPAGAPEAAEPFSSIFQFPRGARAGTFMHMLLERLDFPAGAGLDGTPLAVLAQRLLQRHGFDVRWSPVVEALVDHVLDTDLGEGGRLRAVSAGRRLVEMEFYFPLRGLGHAALNRFLGDYRGAGAAPRLNFGTLAGLMKGFIDLVFERDGRFFIVDYKSNHLGEHAADYGRGRLAQAMVEHDYDLQYLIYSVALHRYLARRVPDYDYERHFGGVYYLFLRGMNGGGAGTGTGVYADRPSFQRIAELERVLAGEGHASSARRPRRVRG